MQKYDALEPESQISYAANRLLHLEADQAPDAKPSTLWRVLVKPAAGLLGR